MNQRDTGLLLNKENIKLHRKYFTEMCKLLGINVLYRAPRENKTWDGYGELDTFYYEPVLVSCIFDEHPTQWTMKKLGWNSELSESVSIISLPYDLEKLQVGALIVVPSGIDNAQGRVFRITRMSTISVYPASITCEIAPVFESETHRADVEDFNNTNFNLLNDEEE